MISTLSRPSADPTMDDVTTPTVRLSKRQVEILQLTANGLGTEQIGQQLGVSEETVRTHTRRTAGKLGARNRAHAVAIGLRAGMIS
jgi:DNA-binding CsgD family transcriptional regulator